MRYCRFALLVAMLLFGSQASGAEATQVDSVEHYSSPLFDQVKSNFAAWDTDQSGDLSAAEIELAVHNPQVTGKAAAAVVSLRRAARAQKEIMPLSLAEIAVRMQTKSTKEAPQPKFESMYDWALKRIEAADKRMFVDVAPQVETIQQGKIGDCFLLAGLGTFAHRQPERLKQMMQPTADGRVLISLGCGATLTVDLPTDGEIALGASSHNSGVWANMYEKAIGTVLLQRSTSDKHLTPLNTIGSGGAPKTPVEIVTGHIVRRHKCTPYREPRDEHGASAADLEPLRTALKQAFADGRMVVGGCGPKGTQTIVPGIVYLHSYGVLEYDETTDTVLFWNPFGQKRTPKGPDGLEFGYTTEHGKFRVPLKEAVMWFGSFSIETDEPVENGKS